MVTVSPDPSPDPTVKTPPPSRLCSALGLAARRYGAAGAEVRIAGRPENGTALDTSSYATGDGAVLLSLSLARRSYDAALAVAHNLAGDPSSAGISDVRVTEVDGLGQAAFRESGHLVREQQDVSHVVWRPGARSWVLSLARIGWAEGADRLVSLAGRITPRLPQ
ncbi:hypothetical protein [Streptomyces sp. NPDC058678]|uniref:hypothetical protein n=1 Tax=Streptomyces sp. NPDC058678 TaxID=3346595 RepID=UPI0036663AA2